MNRREKIRAFLGRRYHVVIASGADWPESGPAGRCRTRRGADQLAAHLSIVQSCRWNEAKARLLGDPPGFVVELR